MDIHGRLETQRMRSAPAYTRGDDIYPDKVEGTRPVFTHEDYNDLRVELLLEFIAEQNLDALVIVGCSFGRETVALSKKVGPKFKIFGADMSQRCIEACRSYELQNASFDVTDIESQSDVLALLARTAAQQRVGVYLCETAPYVLPDKLQEFFNTIYRAPNVQGVQILEPLYIDWQSRFGLGAMFSFQQGYWRHNYYKMLEQAGFQITKTDTLSGNVRSTLTHQPLWLVRASKA